MDKTPELKNEFAQVKGKLAEKGNVRLAKQTLRQMQAVIGALQKEGMSATLETRPTGFSHKFAAGDVTVDGLVIPFTISYHNSSFHAVHFLMEGGQAGEILVTMGEDRLSEKFRTFLLEMVAARDLYAEHNVSAPRQSSPPKLTA